MCDSSNGEVDKWQVKAVKSVKFSCLYKAPSFLFNQFQRRFSLDRLCSAAMNLTKFGDNALLKLQVGGPFTGGVTDVTSQEYILIQVEQTEQPRRRRPQQVSVRRRGLTWRRTSSLIPPVRPSTGDS